MSSRRALGTVGSFTLGVGLLLTACTIEVPNPDEFEPGGGGSEGDSSGAGGSSGGSTNASATSAGGAGGTGGSADDNCPDDPSSDQTDTDGDGLGNVCDDDDDQDGFVDEEDPEPLDVDVPGDFSTHEKVLADPRMADAIESLREAGFELETYLETNPPDVAGYFRKDAGDGEFVANSGGGGVGGRPPWRR